MEELIKFLDNLKEIALKLAELADALVKLALGLGTLASVIKMVVDSLL